MITTLPNGHIAVTVPLAFKYYILESGMGKKQGLFWKDGTKSPPWIVLPPGKWLIVGRASELSEEQWRGIVERKENGYECYDLLVYGAPYSPMDTANQSGLSLLSHNKLEASKILILKKL